MNLACPSQWQIEAARDGRLSGDDAARFEVHRARCESCRLEAAQMEYVAKLVRRADPSQLDEISLRRLRQRMLASADARLRSAPTPRFGAQGIIVAIALPGALAAALAFRPHIEHVVARSTTGASREPTTVVQTTGPVAQHEVANREDSSAAVQEPYPAQVSSSSSFLDSAPKSDPMAAKPPRHGIGKATKSAVSVPAPAASAPADRDGAAEDLAYLRVLALLEEGRKPEAVLAAQVYLARFPAGFRRVEVRAIAFGR